MSHGECRYAVRTYRDHLACFRCRKVWRKYVKAVKPTRKHTDVSCPDCGGEVVSMGYDFKAPRRNDLKQWRKVELLARRGVLYHSAGWCGPGYRPKTLREVPQFLVEREEPRTEVERILRK